MRRLFATVLAATCCACAEIPAPKPVLPDAMLLRGRFLDDTGGRHAITPSDWLQGPSARYRIVYWNLTEHYLIAQRDSGSRADRGQWTRIEWVDLEGTGPYAWAYCFRVNGAASQSDAESGGSARLDTATSGCNGHPYTRMQVVAENR